MGTVLDGQSSQQKGRLHAHVHAGTQAEDGVRMGEANEEGNLRQEPRTNWPRAPVTCAYIELW